MPMAFKIGYKWDFGDYGNEAFYEGNAQVDIFPENFGSLQIMAHFPRKLVKSFQYFSNQLLGFYLFIVLQRGNRKMLLGNLLTKI